MLSVLSYNLTSQEGPSPRTVSPTTTTPLHDMTQAYQLAQTPCSQVSSL